MLLKLRNNLRFSTINNKSFKFIADSPHELARYLW